MFNGKINLCNIFVDNQDDYETLSGIYRDCTGINISKDEPTFTNSDTPILITGWYKVNTLFPEQKISNKAISTETHNISWTFSSKESKEEFNKDTELFIKKHIDNFFKVNFIFYDELFNGDFEEFINKNINKEEKCFIYFYNKACYLWNDSKTIVIGLEGFNYTGKDSKDIITTFINNNNCIAFNYENLNGFVCFDKLNKTITIENIIWAREHKNIYVKDLSRAFLNKDINRYVPYLMSLQFNDNLTDDEIKSCNRQSVRDIITNWLSERAIFFDKDYKLDNNIKVRWSNYKKYTKSKYSNKRAITGRMYCVSGFNPQSLPKKSEIREHIVSRYDKGKIALFDYVSFESKLSLYFTKDKEFIEKYKDSDLHVEIAKIIFKTEDPNELQRKIGKNINHAIIFGGGNETVLKILSEFKNKEEILKEVKVFLAPILKTAELVKNVYNEIGYLKSHLGTILRPNKKYASYNNYIQLTATEIVVDKLYEIKEFLKHKKTKFMFQNQDSFIFDVHPNEIGLIEELEVMLSNYNGLYFKIDCKVGNNYFECK